jgi:cysteine desulfuration protein SufE
MAEQDFDELVENFELFDDWEERYRYVIDLGKQMPEFPETLKTDATLVEGCVSRVWLNEQVSGEGSSAVIEFSGDSDAFIVKGLIAVLQSLLSGKTARDILDTDISEQLSRIDLSAHLSPQRSNGLNAMVGRIKGFAEAQT